MSKSLVETEISEVWTLSWKLLDVAGFLLAAIMLANKNDKFGQKKVELTGKYVFNFSRLFYCLPMVLVYGS